MCGLASQSNHNSSASRVHLVIDQVPKPLIVDRSYENQVVKRVSCIRIEHPLVAIALKSCTMELAAFLLHVEVRERGGIFAEIAANGCDFSSKAF